MLLFTLAALAISAHAPHPAPAPVEPTVETDPVPSADDAADDAAVWIHPTDPASSLVLATDKKHGLFVYDLAGRQVQALPVGRLNNVDIRQQPPGAASPDLAAATNRTTKTIDFFAIDSRGQVRTAGAVPSGFDDPYGICLLRAPTGELHAVACDKSGLVRRWKLSFDAVAAAVVAEPVDEFHIGGQSEGMVADDQLGFLFIAEEAVGIWRYPLAPLQASGRSPPRVLIAAVRPLGDLVADVEGLTILRPPPQPGQPPGPAFLLASAQGENSFRVYDLAPPHALRGSFAVAAGPGIGSVEETDGIEACGHPLGPAFPRGIVIVQDGDNAPRAQNFKFIPWQRIEATLAPSPPPATPR